MAIDVAVLRARLRFESEGAAEATRDAQNVKQAIEGIGQSASRQAEEVRRITDTLNHAMELVGTAAESSSFKAKEAGVNLRQAVEEYRAIEQAVLAADQILSSFGVTHETLGATIDGLRASITSSQSTIESYQASIDAVKDTIRELENQRTEAALALEEERRKAIVEQINEQKESLQELIDLQDEEKDRQDTAQVNLGQLEAVQAGLGQAPDLATKALAAIEDKAKAAGKALQEGKKEGKGFSDILGKFNNGAGFTISNLASLAARATGVGAAAIIAVRGLIRLFQWLVKIGSQMIAAADSMILFSGEVQQAGAELGKLERFSGAKLLNFLSEASNRFRSFGNDAETSLEAASRVAQVANIAQFFNATPGDADQVANLITRSLESLNFEGLRSLGIDVGRVNESFRQLAEDGMGKGVQTGAALAEIIRQVNGRLGEAQGQADREKSSLAGLRAEYQSMIEAVGRSQEMQSAVRNLVAQIREAFPTLKQFFILIGQGVVAAVRIAVVAIDIFLASIAKIQRTMAGIIDNPATSFLFKMLVPFGDDMIKAAGGADELAAALRKQADDIDAARNSLGKFDDDIKAAETDLPDLVNGLEDMAQTLRDVRQEAAQGAGLAGQIQSLGDAFVAMQEDLNPRTAMAGLNQFSSVIDTVINDGIESLEVFRLRAQAAFDLGFFNEAELAAANENFDNIESILGPIAQKAEELRAEQERLAASKLTGLQGEFKKTQDATASAQSQVESYTESLYQIPGRVSTQVDLVFAQHGTIGPMGTEPGRYVAPSEIPGSGSSADEFRVQTAASRERDRQEMRSLKETIDAVATANKGSGVSQAEKGRFRGDLERQGLFGRSGGGGGGAGSTLATIEQIREFMQEVNRAIGIASRGGVRIGTAGNAIPFEEGSFLNAQGGGLSVDTILIRGVWDFADPAAKRQIIKELQEALQSLQGEV